ncbi:MAG: DUF6265 family protein [Pirellulaceae bacterium]
MIQLKSAALGLLSVATLVAVANDRLAIAQESKSPKDDKQVVSELDLADVAWIAGHWQGKGLGGRFEETWNAPFGGAMMGMFKLVRDDKVVFYELLTIVEKESGIALRLKHFSGDLVAWEEKEEVEEFRLKSADAKRIAFEGLRFERVGKSGMRIVVEDDSGDTEKDLVFECSRVVGLVRKR